MAPSECVCLNFMHHDPLATIKRNVEACKAAASDHECICESLDCKLFTNKGWRIRTQGLRRYCKSDDHNCTCQGELMFLTYMNATCLAVYHHCICKESLDGEVCRSKNHTCICSHDDNPNCFCAKCGCKGVRSDEEDEEASLPLSKRVRVE